MMHHMGDGKKQGSSMFDKQDSDTDTDTDRRATHMATHMATQPARHCESSTHLDYDYAPTQATQLTCGLSIC